MHKTMHTHDLRSRKGCAWPCLEAPAFEDKIVQTGHVTEALGAIAHGARQVKHLSGPIVHARGNHTHWASLRHWHRCTALFAIARAFPIRCVGLSLCVFSNYAVAQFARCGHSGPCVSFRADLFGKKRYAYSHGGQRSTQTHAGWRSAGCPVLASTRPPALRGGTGNRVAEFSFYRPLTPV